MEVQRDLKKSGGGGRWILKGNCWWQRVAELCTTATTTTTTAFNYNYTLCNNKVLYCMDYIWPTHSH